MYANIKVRLHYRIILCKEIVFIKFAYYLTVLYKYFDIDKKNKTYKTNYRLCANKMIIIIFGFRWRKK